MNIKPLSDKILINPSKLEAAKSTGGIIIPDTAKEKPQEGKVVAVGPGKTDEMGNVIKMIVKVGDKVLFSQYGGTMITHKGKEYLILSESDILAVIK